MTIFITFHPHNFKHSKVFSIQTDLTSSCFLNKGSEINLELKECGGDEQAAHCCLSNRRGYHWWRSSQQRLAVIPRSLGLGPDAFYLPARSHPTLNMKFKVK